MAHQNEQSKVGVLFFKKSDVLEEDNSKKIVVLGTLHLAIQDTLTEQLLGIEEDDTDGTVTGIPIPG